MNRIAKYASLGVATGALLLGSIAAASAADLVILTSWTKGDARRPALDKIVEGFTKQTGITVEIDASSNEGGAIASVYETSLLAGKEADLVLASLEGKLLDWAKRKAVVPVNDFVAAWGLDKTIPVDAIADWTDSDGHVEGLPYLKFTWPWWYNTTLLKQAGVNAVPKTVDELIAAAKALRKAGIEPVTIGGSDWSGEKMMLQIVQSYMPRDEAKKVLSTGGYCANADAMKGVNLLVRLRDEGVFVDGVQGLTSNDATAAFMTGVAAISSMGSWSYKDGEGIAASVTLAGFPAVDGGAYSKPTYYTGATLSGWFVTPAGAKKLDAIKKLVQFVYAPEQIGTLIDHTGAIPVVNVDPKLVAQKAGSTMMTKSMAELPGTVDAAVMPDVWVPGPVTEALYRATSIVFTNGNGPGKVCAALDEAYKK